MAQISKPMPPSMPYMCYVPKSKNALKYLAIDVHMTYVKSPTWF